MNLMRYRFVLSSLYYTLHRWRLARAEEYIFDLVAEFSTHHENIAKSVSRFLGISEKTHNKYSHIHVN
jgi:hypothetical protein